VRRPVPLLFGSLAEITDRLSPPQPCVGCKRPSRTQPCPRCEIESRSGTVRRWHISHSPTLRPLRALYFFGRYAEYRSAAPTGLALALRRFKYAGDRRAGHALRRLMQRDASVLAGQFDVVVPVPLHQARMARRGFNQSAWLAHGVAHRLSLPLAPDALVRCYDGPAQASLGAAARRSKSHAMFRLGNERVTGLRVLLVDDVLTTGTTARAAGTELYLRGGARSVSALVLLVADSALCAHTHKRELRLG